MSSQIAADYNGKSNIFWIKDKPQILGDIKARPTAISMLGDVSGRSILEAGCGSGYIARALAVKGAKVTGIDISSKMLDLAREPEIRRPLGINYVNGNICARNFNEAEFDGAICTGVVHHLTTPQYALFLAETRRALKKDAPLAISLLHPSMFYPTSPARIDTQCWIRLRSINRDDFVDGKEFSEELYDAYGRHFDSTLVYHSFGSLIEILNANRFSVEEIKEPLYDPIDQRHENWGDRFGYPSHLVIKAINRGGK